MYARNVDRPDRCIKGIIPSYMLKNIAKNAKGKAQDNALHTLSLSSFMRGKRSVMGPLAFAAMVSAGGKYREVYDMKNNPNSDDLPGEIGRKEEDAKSSDLAVNEAFDGAGGTYDMYGDLFDRNSIDNKGMRLISSVHFDKDYQNAFWEGRQMVYGDGDGEVFAVGGFTHCIDVIGHEISHGVTEHESSLVYQGQSGALNESFSDVMGIMLKQRVLGQTAENADWLIGEGILAPKIHGVALRSMKEPGTAYDDPVLGKDPQPGHMKNYFQTWRDNGGVHINSGITNRAFCLVATEIGGYSWEKAGKIWYNAFLKGRLSESANFQDAANATFAVAGELFGAGGSEQEAVRNGWKMVGITV